MDRSGIARLLRIPQLGVKAKVGIVIFALVAGIVAYGVYGSLERTISLHSRIVAVETSNQRLQHQIADREREIQAAQSTSWVEEQARLLGYVMPGEHVYLILPPSAGPVHSGGVQAPLVNEPITTPTPSPSPTPSPTSTPSPTPGVSAGQASPSPSPTAVTITVP